MDEEYSLLIPTQVGGETVVVSVKIDPDAESEVGPLDAANLNDSLRGLVAVASATIEAAGKLAWSRATIELGVDFAIESGGLVAMIGKAKASSALKVTFEFSRERLVDPVA